MNKGQNFRKGKEGLMLSLQYFWLMGLTITSKICCTMWTEWPSVGVFAQKSGKFCRPLNLPDYVENRAGGS
jgi:hypothetical protein